MFLKPKEKPEKEELDIKEDIKSDLQVNSLSDMDTQEDDSVAELEYLTTELRAFSKKLDSSKIKVQLDQNLDKDKDLDLEGDQKLIEEILSSKTNVDTILKERTFKALLNVYVTKNNVSWVLTDVFGANLFYKITGGSICKRGTDKDSSKTTIKNFETMIKCCEELKIDHLIVHLNTGYSTKKSPKNTKNLIKILSLFKHSDITTFEEIIKKRKPCVSTVRVKGGRRGRRT